ncbi:hypothetical protein HanHA89_Chr04g0137831 [Helianthus annuus]|nr:hypothetical protein HanHA89_Chr04g0137831 [Helianthus annuus]
MMSSLRHDDDVLVSSSLASHTSSRTDRGMSLTSVLNRTEPSHIHPHDKCINKDSYKYNNTVISE